MTATATAAAAAAANVNTASANVSLHPLASRDGKQSSTIVSVQVPQDEGDVEIHDVNDAHSPRFGDPATPRLSAQMEPLKEWGIEHSDIDQYPVIDDNAVTITYTDDEGVPQTCVVEDAPPIRAMSAARFADLHSRYSSLDVPHSVVFPFLHGVDGSNPAQNAFFHAPPSGQPAPRYRGLTVVRADMPTPLQRARMSGLNDRRRSSGASNSKSDWHSRANSVAASSLSSHEGSRSGNGSRRSSDEEEGMPAPRVSNQSSYGADFGFSPVSSSSSASISSSANSSSERDSLFSDNMDDSNEDSMTSITTSCASKEGGHHKHSSTSYDPQPDQCLLNSSLYPYEIIRPPVMLNKKTQTAYHVGPSAHQRTPSGAVLLQSAQFYQPAQPEGVNLRNFKIQAAKYATISDIVIYCPAGLHEGAWTLARWFQEAHEASWDERCINGLGGLRYNVFVISEPFSVFEQSHSHLVAVDSAGKIRSSVDFVDREREEMQRLTAATLLADNVWLGCSADVPAASSSDDRSANDANPNDYSICIECHDAAEVPAAERLQSAVHYLDTMEHARSQDKTTRQHLHNVEEEKMGDSYFTLDEHPSPRLGPNGWMPGMYRTTSQSNSINQEECNRASGIVFLDCSSAGGLEDETQMSKYAEDLIQLCDWIKTQAQPAKSAQATRSVPTSPGLLSGALRGVHGNRSNSSSPTSSLRSTSHGRHSGLSPVNGTTPNIREKARRVLLHCGDGYTETSILALAYLMYVKGLSLPAAYLDLQLRAQRSFFVYARDMTFLKKLEQHVIAARRLLEKHSEVAIEAPPRPKSKHSFSWLGSEDRDHRRRVAGRRDSMSSAASSEAAPVEQSSWARSLAGLVSVGSKKSGATSQQSADRDHPSISRALTPTPASIRERRDRSVSFDNDSQSHAWFHDSRFEGAFPSRILPFLYLGNLNHALNPAMLHVLGITHVVSVGESALHPPVAAAAALTSNVSIDGNGISSGGSALPTLPEPEPINSLWQEEKQGRISVMDLKNVSDDGIDPLRSTMRQAVEYIENARRSGGKVLVHCRVGVSRSTTIVLAYVMAHLDLSLVESYLLVRSRRLSILIQPHLLFFWELRGWETYLISQKLKRQIESAGGHRSNSSSPSHLLANNQFALAGLSLDEAAANGETQLLEKLDSIGVSCGFGENEAADQLNVDIGAGAGSPYGFKVSDVEKRPFGSGSPHQIKAEALRLNWGFLCREIAALNERYF